MFSSRAEVIRHCNLPENFPERPGLARCGGRSAGCGFRRSKASRFLSVLFALCWLSACRTTPLLPAVNLGEPGWRLRQGQAVWRSKRDAPEIAGELLLAAHPDGRSFLQFTKTPLPFVVAQTTTNAWQIEFVAENKTFCGSGRPPSRLGWLHLARCLTGRVPPANWRWKQLDEGRWRLENNLSGERMEGFLTP